MVYISMDVDVEDILVQAKRLFASLSISTHIGLVL